MNTYQTIMLIARNMANEEDRTQRAFMAIEIIDLLKSLQDEKYLTEYYQGL